MGDMTFQRYIVLKLRLTINPQNFSFSVDVNLQQLMQLIVRF